MEYCYAMGKKEKLIARLKSLPKDFTFDEADSLLGYLGYSKGNKGKTSGSRVEFRNIDLGARLIMHKPHPDTTLKPYQTKQLKKHLEQEGLI